MTKSNKLLSGIMLLAMVAAMLVSMTACGNSKNPVDTNQAVELPVADGATIGEGKTSFPVEVTDRDGQKISFTVQTDETTVGAALQKLGVIDGEDGQYGLYIKTVNGVSADYDTDGVYWAFYVDGTYASASADLTDITAGSTYAFCVEAG